MPSSPRSCRATTRPDVHQCRHGAVQERLHWLERRPTPRHHGAEMRARRRQTQPSTRRLYRAPPPSSRCSAASPSAIISRTVPSSRGIWCKIRPAGRSFTVTVHVDDQAFDLWKKTRGCPRAGSSASPAPTISGRWRPRPCGPCSKYSTTRTAHPQQPAQLARSDGDRFIEIWNLVFMQFEQLPAASASTAAFDRHRHGARAHRRCTAGHARQLQDRSVRRVISPSRT